MIAIDRFDFLAETLDGDEINSSSGRTDTIHWSRPEPGVMIFEPAAGYSENIIISAAVHGNETAPIEIVNRLIIAILKGEYPLHVRLMVMLGNLEAMRQGERYLLVDMNRLFSDHYQRYESCYETQRAATLQRVVADFYAKDVDKARYHFDLHTAIRSSHHIAFGLLPHLASGGYQPAMLNWLQSVGLEALVVNHAPAATFSYFTSQQFSANSCTLELGKAKPFGENELQQFSGINSGLINLVSGKIVAENNLSKSNASEKNAPLAVYKVADVIIKHSDQFKLNVADDVSNFTEFPKGYAIANDYLKETSEEIIYQVQEKSGYILFPNRHVKSGLRAGLLLVKSNFNSIADVI